MVADGGQHGKGKHDQRDVTMPTVPGTGLVVVESEFVLGGFEAVLDRPAMAFYPDQRFDWRASQRPCREVGEVAVGDLATDQQAARP